jgi:hypothetical protein
MDMTEKDPFDMIPHEERDALGALEPTVLRTRLAEVKLSDIDNKRAQAEDKQLAEAKAAVKEAQKPYRERSARNQAVIDAHRTLAATLPERLVQDETAKAALDEVDNEEAEKDDEKLASLKEAAKEAAEGYKEVSKRNKQLVKFIKRVLSDKAAI